MTSPAQHAAATAGALASWQHEFTGCRIWPEETVDGAWLGAVRRQSMARPHTVVRSDADEVRAALTSPTGP